MDRFSVADLTTPPGPTARRAADFPRPCAFSRPRQAPRWARNRPAASPGVVGISLRVHNFNAASLDNLIPRVSLLARRRLARLPEGASVATRPTWGGLAGVEENAHGLRKVRPARRAVGPGGVGGGLRHESGPSGRPPGRRPRRRGGRRLPAAPGAGPGMRSPRSASDRRPPALPWSPRRRHRSISGPPAEALGRPQLGHQRARDPGLTWIDRSRSVTSRTTRTCSTQRSRAAASPMLQRP